MFISVMRDDDSTTRLVSLSPLRYVVSVPRTKQVGIRDLLGPDKFSNTSPSAALKVPATDTSKPSQTNEGEVSDAVEKEFTMNASLNPRYRHQMTGDGLNLQMSWPEFYDENNSFATQILKQSLPDTLAAKGLAHWNVDLGQKWSDTADKARADERIQLSKWIPGKLKSRKEPTVTKPDGEAAVPSEDGANATTIQAGNPA